MKFDDAREVEQLCYQIRLADYSRGLDRARIDKLFNGHPPLSDEEAEQNQTAVNVNFLESTRLGHDARSQFNNVFLKPGIFFTLQTDSGPIHKRSKWGHIVTRRMNKIMKRSQFYFECFRSKFALDVLHGIGPSVWPDQEQWCPEPAAICDIGIPARTYLHMRNLPFYYIYRSYTFPDLKRLPPGPNIDPGWNMPLVERIFEWIDRETMMLMGSNWPEVWSPEKTAERVKGDGGFYVGDQVPTVDAFDFYFYSDDGKDCGWRRRIILDSWSTPENTGGTLTSSRRSGDLYSGETQFLYNGGTRKFADKRENVIAFQFADLSAVAPFQFHSIRSLGYLLYAVCHLQNRLRCAFTEAVFENLLQMFRVKSMEDVQRALKLKLHNFAFIDDNLTPMPANERFQPNLGLVELGLAQNAQLIQEHSSSYTQNQNFSRDRVEKTKFQVMAEVNAMTSLTSAGLNQAYMYQNFEYQEIVRRFFRKNSQDMDVNEFQAGCLKEGVPEKYLCADYWECEPERIMGAGNKTLEMTIAQQLMEWRPLFNPQAQVEILRDSVLAITDDPGRADRLVPEEPKVSDSVHDSELAFGTLMQGIPVTPKPNLNAIEVAATITKLVVQKVQMIMQSGGVGTPEDVMGLKLAIGYAAQFLGQLAQDIGQKPIVQKISSALGEANNQIKAMEQRLAEMMKAQAQGNGGGGMDPKDAAKIQATMATAQAKVQNMRESHAARTAQRQIQFEQKLKQDEAEHNLQLAKQAKEQAIDIATTDAKTAAEIRQARTTAAVENQIAQEQAAQTSSENPEK